MVTNAFAGYLFERGVFWVAVAFVLFIALFGLRLWREIAKLLDNRIATIQRQLDDAARLRAEAEAMLQDATRRRQDAITQAEHMLAAAQDEARRLAQTMAEDATTAAARREKMAQERIAAAEQDVTRDLRLAAITLATEATTLVLTQSITATNDTPLIDQAIKKIPPTMRAA